MKKTLVLLSYIIMSLNASAQEYADPLNRSDTLSDTGYVAHAKDIVMSSQQRTSLSSLQTKKLNGRRNGRMHGGIDKKKRHSK